MANPYQILRIRPGASVEQIEDAYRRMRRLVSIRGAGDGVKERAVNAAYAILSDPERRRRLDRGPDSGLLGRLRRVIPFL